MSDQPTTDTPAAAAGPTPREQLGALIAQSKAMLDAAGYVVTARPDTAFAPAYVELPEPLRVEVCPDCGLTFAVRLDWFLARAEQRGAVYCPAGHLIELKRGMPADVKVMTTRELLARLRTVETDNQRLRLTLDRVPRLDAPPVTPAEVERRVKLLAATAPVTAFGQHVCQLCGEQFKTATSGRRHFTKHHRDEVAAMAPERFDRP